MWSVEGRVGGAVQIHLGVSLTLLDTGDLLVRGLMTLGNEGEGLQDLWQSDELLATQSQAQLETLVKELQQRLPDFARAFAQQLA